MPRLPGQRDRRETDRFLFGKSHSHKSSAVKIVNEQMRRTNGSLLSKLPEAFTIYSLQRMRARVK